MRQIRDFIKEVYRLDELGEHGAAQFKIFSHIQYLLDKEDFLLLHRVLNSLQPERLSHSSIKAFLSSTIFYEPKIPARADFYEKVLKSALVVPSTSWMQKLKPTAKEETNE